MPDDDIVFKQAGLFRGNVDVEVGVELIQIVDGECPGSGYAFKQRPVDARFLEMRMGEKDQDAPHGPFSS